LNKVTKSKFLELTPAPIKKAGRKRLKMGRAGRTLTRASLWEVSFGVALPGSRGSVEGLLMPADEGRGKRVGETHGAQGRGCGTIQKSGLGARRTSS